LSKQIDVRALNEPGHWGPSDHCLVEITVGCDEHEWDAAHPREPSAPE